MQDTEPTLMDLVKQEVKQEDPQFFEVDPHHEELRESVRNIPPPEVQEMLKRMYLKGIQVKRKVDIGRNEACHCGSGKKYKKCHMKQDTQYEAIHHYGFLPSKTDPDPTENNPSEE